MRAISLAWTTNTAGAATTLGPTVVGKVFAIRYIPGSTDTGATVTVTSESDSSFPLLVKATAGTSNVTFYPRVLVNGNTDGAALTGTAGGDRALPIAHGQLKVVIASGGAVKTGNIVVFLED